MEIDTPIKSPASPTTGYKTSTIWDLRTKKYKNVVIEVCLFILMMELAERLSYYGINQGLKNFMQKIGWSLVSASALKSTWTSICYMTPIFGAYLADEKWGRFRTILIFGIWYCIGDFLVAISAYPSIMDNESVVNPIFVIGLYIGIGVGTGAIKSNVITFGADQFDPDDPKEVTQKETYFSYFYFCINAGATFSYGYLSQLCVDGSAQIPAEYGYFATFMICATVMAVAICFLLIGYPRYVHMQPNDRAVSTFVRLIAHNCRVTKKGALLVIASAIMFFSVWVNVIAAFTADKGNTGQNVSYLAGAMVLFGVISWIYVGYDQSFLDASKSSNGGPFDDDAVDDYKRLIRVLPFASFTIIWQCAYDQTDANFQSITQQTDLRTDRSDPDSYQIPGAMLGVFDPLVIVICIPILETFIYPLYEKWAGKPPSHFGKAATGLVVATIGIFWTAIFEIIRRDAGQLEYNGKPIKDDGSGVPMNNITWLAAIPMYVFIALAECLINVTAYDVFYSYVSMKLKSTSQSVNLLMISMGSTMTSVFTIMFSKYIPTDNLNDANLEYMFYFVGAVSIVNLLGFVFVMKKMDFGMSTSPDYDALFAKNSVARQSIASAK